MNRLDIRHPSRCAALALTAVEPLRAIPTQHLVCGRERGDVDDVCGTKNGGEDYSEVMSWKINEGIIAPLRGWSVTLVVGRLCRCRRQATAPSNG